MGKIIDTHTHLFDEAFDQEREQVIARAVESGIYKMMSPAIDSSTHERMFALCDTYPSLCLPMMGLHPTSVNDNPGWRDELDIVEKYLSNGDRKFWAVGEVGLDLYWSREWKLQQKEAFACQIDLALYYGLPLAIHTRDAWPEMLDILSGYKGRGLKGVMHAFSGTIEDCHTVKKCGDFMFGIGGTVTYKKSMLPDLLTTISLEEIVLETDSPYLTPAPFRGKRNESSYIHFVAAKVAEIKGIGEEEVAAVTTDNAIRIFSLE